VCGLLDAILGLSVDARAHQARIEHPALPPYVDWVRLRGVRLGDARVSLEFRREHEQVAVSVTEYSGDVQVAMEP
jgi:hypothetical protein